MSDFDLVDVPTEEPERLMEPWEIYLTDPTVRTAVERLVQERVQEDPNRIVSYQEVATEVAKTVAPALHNIAAQDARYLLAPEAAQDDEDAWRRQADPAFGASIETFERDALGEAITDGPETAEGVRYSEGLLNRAGEVPPPPEEDSGLFGLPVVFRRPEPFDWPVPPTRDDAPENEHLLMGYTATFRAESMEELLAREPEMRRLWVKMLLDFEQAIRDVDRIPLGVPMLDIEKSPLFASTDGEHDFRPYVARLRVITVPAHDRTFHLDMFIGEQADLEEGLPNWAEDRPNCRVRRFEHHGPYAMAITWDRHRHGGLAFAFGGEGDAVGGLSPESFREALATLFGFTPEQLALDPGGNDQERGSG